MAYTTAQLRPSAVLVSGSLLLLSACGWVDSGVGGNEPPVTETSDYTVIAGETLEVGPEEGVLADDFDVGGRSLMAEVVTEPAHASDFVLNMDGSFRYIHDGSETTSDRFEYAASDQIDQSDPTPVSLRIIHRPRAADDAVATDAGATVRIEVLANDSDLDDGIRPSSVSITAGPDHGTAQPHEDGTVSYTPDGGFSGRDEFAYRVSDDSALESNTARVTIDVQAIRPAPTPVPPPEPPPTPDPEPTPPPPEDDPGDAEGDDNDGSDSDEKAERKEREKREREIAKELERERKEVEKRARRRGDDDEDNRRLWAEDDDYEESGAGVLTVGSLSGLLANDRLAGRSDGAYLSGITFTSSQPWAAVLVTPPAHEKVTLAPDGSFHYEAKDSGAVEPVDTFTYRVRQGEMASALATVTIRSGGGPDACWILPAAGTLETTLPGVRPEAAPVLYRIEQPPTAGELLLLDQTTGRFSYHSTGTSNTTRPDRFEYSIHGVGDEPRHFSARIVRTPRLMLLGNRTPAPDKNQAARLGDLRYTLYEALREAGHAPDWVGSQQTGPDAGFDPNHELHPGWSGDELTWGREGYPTDGVRAWLDGSPADVVLLQIDPEPNPALAALLDELERWTAGPTGNPVTVLVPEQAAAAIQGGERAHLRIISVDAATETSPLAGVETLAAHLPRCP